MQCIGVRVHITWLLDAAAKVTSDPCHSIVKERHLKGCVEAMLARIKKATGSIIARC